MVLAAEDLGEVVRKLNNLPRYVPLVSPTVNPDPGEFYSLGNHVAQQLEGKRDSLTAEEYFRAALSHRRGSHIAPSGEEILAVAHAVFPERFVMEITTYMADLERGKRPPH